MRSTEWRKYLCSQQSHIWSLENQFFYFLNTWLIIFFDIETYMNFARRHRYLIKWFFFLFFLLKWKLPQLAWVVVNEEVDKEKAIRFFFLLYFYLWSEQTNDEWNWISRLFQVHTYTYINVKVKHAVSTSMVTSIDILHWRNE